LLLQLARGNPTVAWREVQSASGKWLERLWAARAGGFEGWRSKRRRWRWSCGRRSRGRRPGRLSGRRSQAPWLVLELCGSRWRPRWGPGGLQRRRTRGRRVLAHALVHAEPLGGPQSRRQGIALVPRVRRRLLELLDHLVRQLLDVSSLRLLEVLE